MRILHPAASSYTVPRISLCDAGSAQEWEPAERIKREIRGSYCGVLLLRLQLDSTRIAAIVCLLHFIMRRVPISFRFVFIKYFIKYVPFLCVLQGCVCCVLYFIIIIMLNALSTHSKHKSIPLLSAVVGCGPRICEMHHMSMTLSVRQERT